MNMLPTRKYGVHAEEVKKKSQDSAVYKQDYVFKRLKKVDNDTPWHSRYNKKVEKRNKKVLKSPLNVGEVVHVLCGKLKQKDAPSVFYKRTANKV